MSDTTKEEKVKRIKTVTSFAVRELQKNGGSDELVQEIQEKGDRAIEVLNKERGE